MGVDFRCDRCGKLLCTSAGGATKLKCPTCGRGSCVPQHLSALPRPNVPAGAGSAHADSQPQVIVEDQDVAFGVMARIMPWVISGFFHLGILVILGFVTIVLIKSPPMESAAGPVEINTLVTDPPVEPVRPPAQGEDPETTFRNATDSKLFTGIKNDPVKGPPVATKDTRIVVDVPITKGGSGRAGRRPGLDDRVKKWKPTVRIDDRKISNAYHIVYVIDRSGSMLDGLEQVKQEMARSIRFLRADRGQTFHALFFSDGEPKENPTRRLVAPTDAEKIAAVRFMRTVQAGSKTGRTNPIPALQRAFRVLNQAPDKPEGKVIYLLTDGEFYDNEDVFKAIHQLNATGKVRVHTALYGSRNARAKDVLQRIATANRGTFRVIEDR